MHQIAGNGRCLKPFHGFVSTASIMSFFIGLSMLFVTPLWTQTPDKPTFEGVEKQATKAREEKRLDEAVALYQEGLKLKPGWQEGSWYLGTSLYGLKRYAEARDAFRHVAILEPGNGPAWGLAGMCEFELKNYPRALEYLLRSETAGFGGKDELAYLVRFRIAILLNRSGEFKEAIDRLLPIAAVGTYPEVIEAMGLSVLRVPLLPSEIPDQDRDLYMRAGEAMNAYLTHDNEGATRLFEELVAAYPDRPNVHNARGSFLMESDPDKAMLEFQRELELNPSQLNALIQMTKLCLKQGSADKAVAFARRVVTISPNGAEPHRLLGESLLESGESSAAIQELETAARQDPEFSQTHFLLAEAYNKAGDKLTASKEMTEFQSLEEKQRSESSQANPPN
jgi:tetratricopeptide (TPR) repeat protein